jgi:hypothetical protein
MTDYPTVDVEKYKHEMVCKQWAVEHGWKSPEEVDKLLNDMLNARWPKQMDQARVEERKRVCEVYDRYIALLAEELNDTAVLAMVHGWTSSRIEQGEKLRAEIKALKGGKDDSR